MNVYIEIDDYLRDWYVHENGGEIPVKPRRGSVESKVLESFLTPQPRGVTPQCDTAGMLAVQIPQFRVKPPETYNHLTRRGCKAFVDSIRNRFDAQLYNDLHTFGRITRRQDELIFAWMEANGIACTEKNWCAVAKRYQRQRNVYLQKLRNDASYQRRKEKKRMNSAQKN